ncbi:MAG: hypothetical protein QG622_985 [Actinomycetota bacterium]|nr:hypothetical protein [Actinomycetota bacterium]
MARLMVVSRSMALALRLADVHDVVGLGADEFRATLPDPRVEGDVEVVVLDVGDPAVAVSAIDRLRAAGVAAPLLVVPGYEPGWAVLETVDAPGVAVASVPVTRGAVLAGIEALLGGPPDGPPGGTPPGAPEGPLRRGWPPTTAPRGGDAPH